VLLHVALGLVLTEDRQTTSTASRWARHLLLPCCSAAVMAVMLAAVLCCRDGRDVLLPCSPGCCAPTICSTNFLNVGILTCLKEEVILYKINQATKHTIC
jgi:hypothetical protein